MDKVVSATVSLSLKLISASIDLAILCIVVYVYYNVAADVTGYIEKLDFEKYQGVEKTVYRIHRRTP